MTERIEQRYSIKLCVALDDSEAETIHKLQRQFYEFRTYFNNTLKSSLIVSKMDKSPSKVNLEMKDHQQSITNKLLIRSGIVTL